MRWGRHVACIGDRRGAYMIFMVNLKKREHLEDRGIDGKIIWK